MATFEAQVEALTTLTITGSSIPTEGQLTQFLKDGVIDVTNRWIAVNPQDERQFMAKTASQSSQGVNLNGAKIISVLREQTTWDYPSATDDDADSTAWRKCRLITADMISSAQIKTSLHYADATSPVYWIDENNKIRVLPAPDSSGDGYVVYYVNNIPQRADGTALVYSDSDLKYFPSNKVYLVPLYASIKTIESKLASLTLSEEDLELANGLTITLQHLKDWYFKSFLPDPKYQLAKAQMQSQAAQGS